jgi:formate hydrogenlyase subunit 6/NADH:ubiquinone oxidoreductase subunit I
MNLIMFDFIMVALKNLFTKPATRNYPKVVRPPYANQRGHIEIDLPACIYCGICSRKCPASAIEVSKADKQWSIDRFKCVMCNECVASCPKKCLHTGAEYTAPTAKMHSDVFKMPEQQPKQFGNAIVPNNQVQANAEKTNTVEKKNA